MFTLRIDLCDIVDNAQVNSHNNSLALAMGELEELCSRQEQVVAEL